MALLDIFKKKQEEKKTEEKKTVEKKKEKEEKVFPVVEVAKEKVINKIEKPAQGEKDFSQIAFRILERPHITEKAINLGQENKYVFKVNQDANKNEVKKAIQELYGVKVEDVNIINIPKKKRRLGRSEGFKSGYKKAVVTVKQGDKIEIGV